MTKRIILRFALIATAVIGISCGKKTEAPTTDSLGSANLQQPAQTRSAQASADSGASKNIAGGRYPIQTAIIHGENEAMGVKKKSTKYIDNFGMRIRDETVSSNFVGGIEMRVRHVNLIKDGWIYSYDPDQKTGTKMRFSVPSGLDFKNMPDPVLKQMGITRVGTETILGKECVIYEYSSNKNNMGMLGKAWIFWGLEPMKLDLAMNKVSIKSHVISIEENVKLDPSLFDVPSDVKLQETATRMPMTPRN
ncbi:MAG: hypothetical protein WCH46_06265 [bacterium]